MSLLGCHKVTNIQLSVVDNGIEKTENLDKVLVKFFQEDYNKSEVDRPCHK
ncbi:MAG: hypothetical protein ACLRPW_10210 [Intestinibacter sp.]